MRNIALFCMFFAASLHVHAMDETQLAKNEYAFMVGRYGNLFPNKEHLAGKKFELASNDFVVIQQAVRKKVEKRLEDFEVFKELYCNLDIEEISPRIGLMQKKLAVLSDKLRKKDVVNGATKEPIMIDVTLLTMCLHMSNSWEASKKATLFTMRYGSKKVTFNINTDVGQWLYKDYIKQYGKPIYY